MQRHWVTSGRSITGRGKERGGLKQGRLETGEGGGREPKNGAPKMTDQIFPIANFVFSHDGHFGLGGEGVSGVLPPPPPAVYGHSNTSLVSSAVQPALAHNAHFDPM